MATIKNINVNNLHVIKVKLIGVKTLSIKMKLIIFLLKRLDCDIEYDVIDKEALEKAVNS